MNRTGAALAVALAACSTDAPTETYRDPAGAFTVKHPVGWAVREEKGNAIFQGAEGWEGVTVTVDAAPREVAGWSRQRDLAMAVEAARGMLLARKGSALVREGPGQTRGLPSHSFEIEFPKDAATFRRRQVVIETPTHIGYFGLTAPADQYDRASRLGEAVLATFRPAGAKPEGDEP